MYDVALLQLMNNSWKMDIPKYLEAQLNCMFQLFRIGIWRILDIPEILENAESKFPDF